MIRSITLDVMCNTWKNTRIVGRPHEYLISCAVGVDSGPMRSWAESPQFSLFEQRRRAERTAISIPEQRASTHTHTHTAGFRVKEKISGHVGSGSVPIRGSNAPPNFDRQHRGADSCRAGARRMKDLERKKGAQRCRCPCWRSALCSAPWPWSLTGCRRLCPR